MTGHAGPADIENAERRKRCLISCVSGAGGPVVHGAVPEVVQPAVCSWRAAGASFPAADLNSDVNAEIGQNFRIRTNSCYAATAYSLAAARIIGERAERKKAVGEHMRAERALDDSRDMAGVPSALPEAQLLGYRAAVDELVKEAGRHPHPADLLAVEELVAKRLEQPELAAVLSRLDGGLDAVVARIIHEIRHYQPSLRSSASDLPTFVRIFLLSQIDSVWWARTAPFVSDADVLCSTELVDLGPLRSAKMLRFRYRAQPAGLPGRARDWAQRQVLPTARPATAGLRFTRSRPVVVAVVNQIARDLAAALPPRTPGLWVNSMVRSVEHQHRLRSLGYAAVLPSSHCVGYACDLEMHWFRRFDREDVLARLLLDRQEAGQLNVIDEGQAWHLCVNPLACGELQSAYDAQLSVG
jgi:hypothetical protein